LIFDEKAIRKNVRDLYNAFSWVPNFKNYYAVKAHPNPYILEILKDE
jgi:diaminopimelate decarboxylase